MNTQQGKYGTGAIYEKIKNEIIKLGGRIYLNHEIIDFKYKNNSINTLVFKNKKSQKLRKEELLISTLPINLTAKILGYKSN